jgi:hypothetical protein
MDDGAPRPPGSSRVGPMAHSGHRVEDGRDGGRVAKANEHFDERV